MSVEDKLVIEKQFADEQMASEPSDVVARWEATKAGFRFMAYGGKVLMAYQLLFGKPIVKNIFTLKDVTLHLQHGLISEWHDQYGTVRFVGHQPTELVQGCFVWHNKQSNLEYTLRDKGYEMRLSMTWRTPHHPRILKDGEFYLLERNAFKDFKWGTGNE